MKPDERINEYYRWVLGRIKEIHDTSPSNKPLRYELSHVFAAGVLGNETEENIFRKLAELGAVKILNEYPRTWEYHHRGIFEFILLQPKFNQIYKEYFVGDEIDPDLLNKELSNLSSKTREWVLDVVKRLEEASEITPKDDLIYFEVATHMGSDNYNEYTILKKLEEWDILTIEGEDDFGNPLVTTSLQKIRAIKRLLNSLSEEYSSANSYFDFIKNRKENPPNIEVPKATKISPSGFSENHKKEIVEGSKKDSTRKGSLKPLEKSGGKPEPIQIAGKIAIEGFEELKNALIRKGNEENKFKFPYKIPAGTHWGNITIKFLDKERVFIQIKHLKHETSYKEMGWVSKGKNPLPNVEWNFLLVLALVNGELSTKDPLSKDKYKKQKQLLTTALQDYFSIDYDPFYPYQSSPEKADNSYKIKITLVPPSDIPFDYLRQDNAKEDMDSQLKDYWKENSPEIYDEE